MTSRRMISTVFNNVCVLIIRVSFPRYFSALSKGECLPVKDRLEVNVATQKTDTGLTPGLLKTLHKQVFSQQPNNTKVMYLMYCISPMLYCFKFASCTVFICLMLTFAYTCILFCVSSCCRFPM